ncbi:MAG TPA: F0F1 ATP synthase subunit A [Acidimicrobiales bacterium]|nr:F0F1 ATP synthase subunit A [Acidimicrobiales bacterium]
MTPHLVAGLEFPPIGELLNWKNIAPGGFNKTALIDVLAVVLTVGLFVVGARKRKMVPTGAQNVAESLIDFVNGSIIMETMGEDGLGYLPFILAIFCFVFVCNITEIIPVFQFPADSRMANPLMLALIVWGVYNFTGIKRQGFATYVKNSTVPPGVPGYLVPLVALIEGAQRFLLNPITLAIRLFANMLAGHLLLVTFALMTDALFFHNTVTITKPIGVLPALMELVIMLFEVLIAVLQAFIFAILTGVYLGPSLHPEH